MDWEGKSLRIGAVTVAFAVLLRLAGSGLPGKLVTLLTGPEAVSAMLFFTTGRVVRPTAPVQPEPETVATLPPLTEPPETEGPSNEQALPVFATEDASLVKVNSSCGYEADLPVLLQNPLSWDLTGTGPTVLILHTHGSESYQPDGTYTESSRYRTQDMEHNMISVGDRLVQILEQNGVGVVHDRKAHDIPSYSSAYACSRESVQKYLEQYPTIRLVLDLHRDSVEDANGSQLRFTTEVEGQSVAQLMLVVGTDAGGLTHPDWPENMSLAVKLHAQLEKNAPGICRAISFRSQRYNQDLSTGALIVEVGSAGNTRQEALLAVEQLGQAILDLCHGTG